MRKIFLSSGHGGTDSGAVSGKYIERNLTIELRNLIVNELKILGASYHIDSDQNALVATLAWLKGKFGSKDILFDIHWNAAASVQANGTEVIVPDSASSYEIQLANSILNAVTSYGFKSRGVKPESNTARKRLGWMRPNAENILLEVCFLTNNLDMKLYEANKHSIAKKIARVLYDYSKI